MIRQAHPSDNKRIAELCFMIWEDMELDIVNEISQERIMNILELSIVNVEYRSYYKMFGFMKSMAKLQVVLLHMMVNTNLIMRKIG